MKGFGVLLALASVSLLLFLGPPALSQGDQHNLSLQIASTLVINDATGAGLFDTTDQTPGVSPAGLQVVPDPGSCSGLIAKLATSMSKFNVNSDRASGQQRWGCRLLNFLPFC